MPRRKASTSAAAPQDLLAASTNPSHQNNNTNDNNNNTKNGNGGGGSGDTTPKSGPQPDAPRRSTRRPQAARNPSSSKRGAGLTPGSQSQKKGTRKPMTTDSSDAEEQRELKKGEEGVNEAIEELAKMERRLKRAVKRQKLKLEESFCVSRGDDVEEKGLNRFPTKHVDDFTSDMNSADHLPTPERDMEDSEYEDEPQGPLPKDEEDIPETLKVAERGAARPSAVNSDYLPLPWKGRLGYACLNTYLRNARPPVFSSRTCRMSSIIDHRHPLQDPSQPEHATKNRPDKTQKAKLELGQQWVHELGLANARDIVKMIRWNDKYGIKFMRLSSEMFPFASHHEHGYKLAPFASEVLAEAGRVAGELGHRLTTHPGQFTQLGSPRKEVVTAAIRDLEYHDEMLTLLRLPPQQDRDAVMILHMGGVFGDKGATLDRFRQNYAGLPPSVKNRLVLENDDVSWSVHDLLPICEELNIPMVLDYHHHNIVFDSQHVREGTKDISDPALMDRILATWRRKGITPKMHYSEQCPGAVTPRDRRKHRPRVLTLPPCPPDADLMIEAKDKEQAVFELMRTFKLPGHELVHDVVPHERPDENRPEVKKKIKKSGRKSKSAQDELAHDAEYQIVDPGMQVTAEDFGMGGPDGRVYWPEGFEDWLRPKKREIKRKADKFEGDDSLEA